MVGMRRMTGHNPFNHHNTANNETAWGLCDVEVVLTKKTGETRQAAPQSQLEPASVRESQLLRHASNILGLLRKPLPIGMKSEKRIG